MQAQAVVAGGWWLDRVTVGSLGKALVANLAAGLTFQSSRKGRRAVSLVSSPQPLATTPHGGSAEKPSKRPHNLGIMSIDLHKM
jgi:hypothetical protein